MERTQQMMDVQGGRPGGMAIMALASALLGFATAYVLLLSQPELVARSTEFVRVRLLPMGPRWLAPVAIAGAAIGLSGVGIYLLSSFVRGVRRSPYLWLSPLWVGVTMAAVAPVAPSVPEGAGEGVADPVVAFGALLVALAGGGLYQLHGRATRVAGGLLWLGAAALVVVEHGLRTGFDLQLALSPEQRLTTFLLTTNWLGLGALAVLMPEQSPAGRQATQAMRAALAQQQQRSVELEAQRDALQQQLSAAERRADRTMEASFERAGGPGWGMLGLVAAGCAVAAGLLGQHLGRRGADERIAVAAHAAERSEESYLSAQAALRERATALRAELEQVRAEQAEQQAQARAQAEALTSCQAAAEEQAQEAEPRTVRARPRTRARRGSRQGRRGRARASAAKSTGTRSGRPAEDPMTDDLTAGGDDPIAGLESQ
ncbi:MAG: hypothetical protein PVI30_28100 [Myxococcales bacterium]|jgi:hypothetical protein